MARPPNLFALRCIFGESKLLRSPALLADPLVSEGAFGGVCGAPSSDGPLHKCDYSTKTFWTVRVFCCKCVSYGTDIVRGHCKVFFA
jgi:hypothetical protein